MKDHGNANTISSILQPLNSMKTSPRNHTTTGVPRAENLAIVLFIAKSFSKVVSERLKYSGPLKLKGIDIAHSSQKLL